MTESGKELVLEKESIEISSQAKAIVITSNNQYAKAGQFTIFIQGMIEEAKKRFDPICKKTDAAHKEAVKQRDDIVVPLKDNLDLVKKKMAGYLEDQRLKEEREQAEALETKRKETEALARKADKLEAAGKIEKADQVRQEAVQKELQIETPKSSAPKMDGIKASISYKAKVINKKLFIQAVAKEKVSDDFLDINQRALNDYADSTKGKMPIPGVIFYTETNMSVSAKKAEPSQVRDVQDAEVSSNGNKEIVDF